MKHAFQLSCQHTSLKAQLITICVKMHFRIGGVGIVDTYNPEGEEEGIHNCIATLLYARKSHPITRSLNSRQCCYMYVCVPITHNQKYY